MIWSMAIQMRYSKQEIEQFLRSVDRTFPVPISEKVELCEFASKLFAKATMCCAYDGEEICSMVAGYTENTIDNIAYVSLVATRTDAQGKGFATGLMEEFISICKTKGLRGVHLYTDTRNKEQLRYTKSSAFENGLLKTKPERTICIMYTGFARDEFGSWEG